MALRGQWAKDGVDTNGAVASKQHIVNRRLFNFAAGDTLLVGWERQHLHQCDVCQEMSLVLVRQVAAGER